MIRRKHIVFLSALIAAVGAFVAVLASVQERDYNLRGYVDPTKTYDLPYRVPRLGVNVELSQYEAQDLAYHFDLMNQLEVTWVRQAVRWDELEPQSEQYEWQQWDQIVQAIANYPELELVVVLHQSPGWSRNATEASAPPDDPAVFALFVHQFASRYGHIIDYYQIWDEPNIRSGWGGIDPNPTDYAALLSASYNAIHAVDPDATVLAAALAPTVEIGPQNMNDIFYLDSLYRLGIAGFSDGIAAKPYGFDKSYDDRQIQPEHLNFSRIVALREVMIRHDDNQTPLWASNWGWNSLGDGWQGQPSIWGEVNVGTQVQYTLGALDRAEREWPWLAGMILNHWQPDSPPDNAQWGFSLLGPDNTPKPLFHALDSRSVNHAASNGLYSARNPYTTYSGIWTVSDFGADVGWVDDSSLSFDFTGRDIALLVRQDNYIAHFYPTINAATPNALPIDVDGNAYLLLRSGDLQPEESLIMVATDLDDDHTHNLRVVADELIPDEMVNRWPLIGFAVSSGNLAEPYNRQIQAALFTLVIASTVIIMTGTQLDWQPILACYNAFGRRLSNIVTLISGAVASFMIMIGMYLTWSDGIPTLFRREPVQLGLSILTSGLIYIGEPGIVLTLIAAFFLFVIIYNHLEAGLVLIVFWTPFFLFPVELYRFAFPMVEVVTLLTFAAWILKSPDLLQASKIRLKWIDVLVVSFSLLGGLSLLWSERTGVALTELRTLIIQPSLFYLMIRTVVRDRRAVVKLVDALLVAGLVVAVIGLFTWFEGSRVITAEGGTERLASVYGSPNNVALLLGRCLPFLLAFCLIIRDRRRFAFAIFALITVSAALLLTQSAGAIFLGVPISLALVVSLAWRRRATLPLGIGLVIFIIIVLTAAQSPRFTRLIDITEGTNFYRIRVWQSAFNLIEDYPLTGVGLDQFLYAFRDTYIMPDAWEEPELSHPHNFLLDFWVRLGIFGVIWFAAIQLFFWRSVLQLYNHYWKQDPFEVALIIGLMGSMANLLAHGLVDNSIFVIDQAYIFMLIIGMLQSIATFPTQTGRDQNSFSPTVSL